MSREEGKTEETHSVIDEEELVDDLASKYGFKQSVILDMTLPSLEREVINEYNMLFSDRNPQKYIHDDELTDEDLKKLIPQKLTDATTEYEVSLSDVIIFLKKCGYPIENCFVSFFSPIFSAYINCGLDPLPTSIKLSKDDLVPLKSLHEGE